MARIVKIIATIASCGFCAGMIACTQMENQTGVYVCIAGCFAGFLVSMLATAQENKKIVEETLKKGPQMEDQSAE